MNKKITITANDPILNSLKFRPYRSLVERRVEPFKPKAGEKQTRAILTPWGETLIASAGDMVVSELDHPNDRWPMKPEIFEATYKITRPGYCIKRALTNMVPLVDLTNGDEDAQVTIHSLEGPTTVRAGDFYLARGTKNEIWAVPKEKVGDEIVLVND